jgi:large subunit ribosomal protein L17
MNKKNSVIHLGKAKNQRDALVKSQVKDFFQHGYIKTTKTRAKAVIQKVDILMAFVADKNLKEVTDYIRDDALVSKISKFDTSNKRSGWVYVTPIKNRPGDNSEVVLLEIAK